MVRFLAVMAFCLLPVASFGQQIRLSGTAQSDHPYVHDLGSGLVLVITTSAIEIQSAPYNSAPYNLDKTNYADCATTPVHGPRPIEFEAWHFDPTPSQRSASPGRIRQFQFTLNAHDNEVECKELGRVLRPDAAGNYAPEPRGFKAPRLGSGKITILHAELSQLEPRQEIEIKSLKFVADISLSPRKKTSGRTRQ